MLVEFSVENYRSFREKQSLSMVAAPRLGRKENIFKPELVAEEGPALLKVAAIYGPNASGKSNLVRAIAAARRLATLQPSAQLQELPVAPFRFDAGLAHSPSRFELHFINEKQRYKFMLAATRERIMEEQLVAFPSGKEALLYSRRYRDERDEYEFGEQLEGGKEVRETWRKLTGPQRLFLAQAVANSSGDLTQLRVPFNWLSGKVATWIDMPMRSVVENLALYEHTNYVAGEISAFVRDLDIPVASIRFDRMPMDIGKRLDKLDANVVGLDSKESSTSKTTLTHQSALGQARFDFSEESLGTQNLMGFFFPWSALNNESPASLRVLIVDEFDNNLHPQIVAALVRKHLQLASRAQLIFTTHDTHLMDAKIMRRDQFWLTERDKNGATQLRSIYDFEGREGEDLEKRYYEGRYRGLPILK